MDVAVPTISERDMGSNINLSVKYIRVFLFLLLLKTSMWTTRIYAPLGDWMADRFGITASYQRGIREGLSAR
jgi:hypothetical protein